MNSRARSIARSRRSRRSHRAREGETRADVSRARLTVAANVVPFVGACALAARVSPSRARVCVSEIFFPPIARLPTSRARSRASPSSLRVDSALGREISLRRSRRLRAPCPPRDVSGTRTFACSVSAPTSRTPRARPCSSSPTPRGTSSTSGKVFRGFASSGGCDCLDSPRTCFSRESTRARAVDSWGCC